MNDPEDPMCVRLVPGPERPLPSEVSAWLLHAAQVAEWISFAEAASALSGGQRPEGAELYPVASRDAPDVPRAVLCS